MWITTGASALVCSFVRRPFPSRALEDSAFSFVVELRIMEPMIRRIKLLNHGPLQSLAVVYPVLQCSPSMPATVSPNESEFQRLLGFLEFGVPFLEALEGIRISYSSHSLLLLLGRLPREDHVVTVEAVEINPAYGHPLAGVGSRTRHLDAGESKGSV